MTAWRYYLLCSRPPVESVERMLDNTVANLKSNRHPNAANIPDYVVARHAAVIALHPAASNAFFDRLENYATHIKNKAGHGGRYSEALDEMRSSKAAEVRAGLNLVRVRRPPPLLGDILAAEAQVLAHERRGKYAHVEEVPIHASYDPNSLLLHASGFAATQYLCEQIIAAKREVVLQTFIYAQGCTQAQLIADALVTKQDALRITPPQDGPFRVVLAINRPRGAIAPRILKESERLGFLGTGAFINRAGDLDEDNGPHGTSLQALCRLLDPALVDLTVVGLRHVGRSLHHKKQVAFDAERAHIPTYNIAGPHTPTPSTSAQGKALPSTHDIAVSFAGSVAATAVRNDIIRSCRRWGEVIMRTGMDSITVKQNRKILSEEFKPLPLPAARPQDTAKLMLAEQDITPAFFDVASLGHLSPAYTVIKCLLANAQDSLCIMTPNLQIFDVLAHLEEAIARGVKVRILLTEHENAESAQLAGFTNEQSVAFLKEFANKHGAADLIDVRWSRDLGQAPSLVDEAPPSSDDATDMTEAETVVAPNGWSPGAIHAKLYIADRRYVCEGSFNLDYQSFKSSEDMVVFELPNSENDFTRYFDAEHARGEAQRRYPDEAPAPTALVRAMASLFQARPGYGPYEVRDVEAESFTMGRREILRGLKEDGKSALRSKMLTTVRRLELQRPQNRPWLENLIEHVRRAQRLRPSRANAAFLHELQELRGEAAAEPLAAPVVA